MEQDKWLGDYKEKNWVVYGKGIYTLRENYDRNIRLTGDPVANRTHLGGCYGMQAYDGESCLRPAREVAGRLFY